MKNKKFVYRTAKVKDYLANKYHDIHLESNDKIYYMGFYGVRNWGDAINSELIRLLSGKTGVIIPFGKPKQYERESIFIHRKYLIRSISKQKSGCLWVRVHKFLRIYNK